MTICDIDGNKINFRNGPHEGPAFDICTDWVIQQIFIVEYLIHYTHDKLKVHNNHNSDDMLQLMHYKSCWYTVIYIAWIYPELASSSDCPIYKIIKYLTLYWSNV
jgi:hypothetical protein